MEGARRRPPPSPPALDSHSLALASALRLLLDDVVVVRDAVGGVVGSDVVDVADDGVRYRLL